MGTLIRTLMPEITSGADSYTFVVGYEEARIGKLENIPILPVLWLLPEHPMEKCKIAPTADF
jgi:hypothetical protein